MERKEALRRVLFFKGLPDSAIDKIASLGTERRLQRGQVLIHEFDRCLGLIVVLSGAVRIYKIDNRGRELTLGLDRPGSSVAEMPLFDGGNNPASAEAAEENTTVFIMPRDRFLTVMAEYPQIADQAVRALAVRMRRLFQMVEAQSLHTVRARLASYLIERSGGRSAFALVETNEEIGNHIGTVRDVVSRTLGNLKESGIIAVSGRRVTVSDMDALHRIAGVEER